MRSVKIEDSFHLFKLKALSGRQTNCIRTIGSFGGKSFPGYANKVLHLFGEVWDEFENCGFNEWQAAQGYLKHVAILKASTELLIDYSNIFTRTELGISL